MEVANLKTLVVVAHPKIKESSTQQFLKETAKISESVTWLELNDVTLSEITRNRTLLHENQRIIFQFPLLWYSAPGILFEWLRITIQQDDETWLKCKELGIVVNIGQSEKSYRLGGSEKYSLSSLLSPLGALANRLGLTLIPYFVIEKFAYQTETAKKKLLIAYLQYLQLNQPINFKERQAWAIKFLKELTVNENNSMIRLVLDNFVEQADRLSELKTEIDLIKKVDDNDY
ncbi:NAD(P)H-dependent oxidoreductase [Liquorilactobacillus hordei DSM 19519]|uniref:Flavodoxin-like fold domain-containing protein n=1 Tax=Liquorilactobacillus hordei DSM 19519 TaxID=1423759 RepID=A0A0R1MDY2_9LACO|nr:hypothetical protein FC92_GL000915 [Liquorilactobacillus hordei DSM 19519]QYH52839.1 NAD(P)H-dependent oxidoreductase [Liquorilactobacillus hordei DSM 19519]